MWYDCVSHPNKEKAKVYLCSKRHCGYNNSYISRPYPKNYGLTRLYILNYSYNAKDACLVRVNSSRMET